MSDGIRETPQETITGVAASSERHLRQLRSLAVALHAKHYSDVTQWRPLDDAEGLLSQIDNMTAALTKPMLGAGTVPLPVEPTDAMLDAGEIGFTRYGGVKGVYRAMVEAAISPERLKGSGRNLADANSKSPIQAREE